MWEYVPLYRALASWRCGPNKLVCSASVCVKLFYKFITIWQGAKRMVAVVGRHGRSCAGHMVSEDKSAWNYFTFTLLNYLLVSRWRLLLPAFGLDSLISSRIYYSWMTVGGSIKFISFFCVAYTQWTIKVWKQILKFCWKKQQICLITKWRVN